MRKLRSFAYVLKGWAKISFSQYGEDIVIIEMLQRFNVPDITYLDIGANDPVQGSNTYNLYLRGYHGVLVEPNSVLCDKIRSVRPKDVCLNYGISNNNQAETDYYMFLPSQSPMNTFSKADAEHYEKEGFTIQSVVKMQLKDINEVIAENFKAPPTLVSLDVEGLDEIILQNLNYDKYAPLLICVETVIYAKEGEMQKRTNIIDLLMLKGYFIYADTNTNTIFCHRKSLDKIIGVRAN